MNNHCTATACQYLIDISSNVMSKRHLSPAPLPPAKRTHNILSQAYTHTPLLTFDTALYDELILFIFAHLSWTDLCSIQVVNKYWARLASDNQVHNDSLLYHKKMESH